MKTVLGFDICYCYRLMNLSKDNENYFFSLLTGVKHILDITLLQPVVISSRCVALAFAQSAQQAVWESQARWQRWALTYLFSTPEGLF